MLTISPESFGIAWPAPLGQSSAANAGVPAAGSTVNVSKVPDARYAFVCRVPMDGTIESVLFVLSAATFGAGAVLRVSIQDVANGFPDNVVDQWWQTTGVVVGSNESGPLTVDGSATGARRSVRAGDIIAIVFDMPSGGGSDVVSFASMQLDGVYTTEAQASWSGGVWTRLYNRLALGALKFQGIGYVYIQGLLPSDSSVGTEILYNSTSGVNQFGAHLKMPVRFLANGFYWRGNAQAGDAVVALYDGATQIAVSPTLDADVEFGAGIYFGAFLAPVVLEPDHEYRLILIPQTSSNVSLATYTIVQAAIGAMPAGPDWYQSKRIIGDPNFLDLQSSVPIIGLLGEPGTPSGHLFEMELDGAGVGWTDVTEDVLITPQVSVEYGINAAGPQDLVAGTGRLGFALDNSEDNTAELLGYYSPDGPNCRPGFKLGIGVRYSYRKPFDDYYRKFVGRLMRADPVSGQFGERRTLCDALDWINEAATVRVTVAAQQGKRHDQILTTLLAAMARQPTSTTFDAGDSTFAYALDNSQTETSPVLAEIQRLCQSEYARCYMRGGMSAGGNLRLEKRTGRLTPVPAASFFGTMQDITPKANIRNRAKVTAHPRTVDAGVQTILFTKPAQNNPVVNPGQTILIQGRYNDPANRAQRVGGTDMNPTSSTISTSSVASPTTITTAAPHGLATGQTVTIFGHAGSTPAIAGQYVVTVTGASTFTIPVNVTGGGTGGTVTTDWLMNAAADGSGADRTANFTVVTVPGANAADFAITNGGGSASFVTKLQIRGRGIYDYNPIDATTINQPSIDAFGESLAQLDMPYQGDLSVAQAVADFIVASWLTAGASEARMRCVPRDAAEMDVLMALEPGVAIAVSELVTGLNGMFYVQHVAETLEEYGPLQVSFEFLLQRALVAAYWQLGTAGFGELGVTTVLAPL